MDLDNNKYPDILVGAYESNNAVYLKSAPVVHLDSEVQFLVPSKQVDLNTKNCQIRDGTPVPCVDIEVTLEYDGVGVPNQIGNFKDKTCPTMQNFSCTYIIIFILVNFLLNRCSPF